jgi:hypothetical protein
MMGTLAVTLAAALWLFDTAKNSEFSPAAYLGGAILVSGLFMTFFAVPSAIERLRQDEALFLSEAFAHEFYSYVMRASFLPLVGPFFAKILESRKPKNPFLANDTTKDH